MQFDIVASVLICGLLAYATLRYSGISRPRAIAGLFIAVVGLGGLALILVQVQELTAQDILSIRNTAVGAIVGLVAGSMMAMKRAKNSD